MAEESPSVIEQPEVLENELGELPEAHNALEIHNPAEICQPEKGIETEGILDDENLSLERTVWDCALLLGLRGPDGQLLLGPMESVLTVISMLLNIAVQGVVIISVQVSMSKSDFDDSIQEGILNNRLFQMHEWSSVHFLSLSTRARNMCNSNYFDFSYAQYDTLSEYLGSYSIGAKDDPVKQVGLSDGPVICGVSLLIWILVMTAEFRRIGDLATSVVQLRLASSTHVDVDEAEDCYVIRKCSCTRKAQWYVVLLIRTLSASWLLVFGAKYLATTVDIGDLILNACALEIVKQVDDLIFEAVFPYDVGVILENTRLWIRKINNSQKRSRLTRKQTSLPAESVLGQLLAHTWLNQLLRCCFIAAMFGISISEYLVPFVHQIKEVEVLMCGHDLDFTAVDHPITDLPVFAAFVKLDKKNVSNATELGSETLGCYETAKREVRSIRAGFGTSFSYNQSQISAMEKNISQIHGMLTTNAEGYFKSSECQDNDFFMSVLQNTCAGSDQVKEVPFFRGRTWCADFKPLCGACPNAASDPAYPDPPDGGMQWYDCVADNFTDVIAIHSVPFAWILKLQQICPKSCNRCRGASQTTGPGSGGISISDPNGVLPPAVPPPAVPPPAVPPLASSSPAASAAPAPAPAASAASTAPAASAASTALATPVAPAPAAPAASATPVAPPAASAPAAPAASAPAGGGVPGSSLAENANKGVPGAGTGPAGKGVSGSSRRLSDSAEILQLKAENQQLRRHIQDLELRFAAIEGKLYNRAGAAHTTDTPIMASKFTTNSEM